MVISLNRKNVTRDKKLIHGSLVKRFSVSEVFESKGQKVQFPEI